jgi:hypothetical protein
MRNSYRIFDGNHECKTPLGTPRYTWEDNIRMDLRETGWEVVDWLHLAQYRDQWMAVMNTVINFRVPQKGGNFLIS